MITPSITPTYLISGDFLEFEELFEKTFPHMIHFKKGDTIFRLTDDRSQYCYYILRGIATFTLHHESGREKGTTFRGKGSIFPLYYTFEKTTLESYLEVIAFTEMTVFKIDKPSLQKLMTDNPAIALRMCDAWGRYASSLLFITADQVFETAESRISNFLYICCNSPELCRNNIIHMTHAEIGMVTGLTREQISRTLGSLKKKGIVDMNRGRIQILSKVC